MGPELLTLGAGIGLSLPLTVLVAGTLVRFGMVPPVLDALAARFPGLVSWPVVVAALVLYVFELLSSKSKLTKPFKHVYDAAGIVVKPLATAVLGLGLMGSGDAASLETGLQQAAVPLAVTAGASVLHGVLWSLASAAVALLTHLVRFLADFLAWLSPVPFIDAAISGAADVHAAAMAALLVFSPTGALVACVAQVVLSIVLLRRMYRRLRSLGGRVRTLLGRKREPILQVGVP